MQDLVGPRGCLYVSILTSLIQMDPYSTSMQLGGPRRDPTAALRPAGPGGPFQRSPPVWDLLNISRQSMQKNVKMSSDMCPDWSRRSALQAASSTLGLSMRSAIECEF